MAEKITQTAGREQLGDFAPMFAHLNDDVLFGEVWNVEAIDIKTKCIITVVSLMASGITDSSLTYHLQNAKKNGVTKEEIAAIITHATMYTGWPKGWAVFRLAKEVWKENEPGCRNNWHIHNAKSGGGQMLICVGGRGWYQEEGKNAVELLPGSVVNIPVGVKHWHGAAKDSWFSHLAREIPGEKGSTTWCEPVSEEDYGKLK